MEDDKDPEVEVEDGESDLGWPMLALDEGLP